MVLIILWLKSMKRAYGGLTTSLFKGRIDGYSFTKGGDILCTSNGRKAFLMTKSLLKGEEWSSWCLFCSCSFIYEFLYTTY